MPRKFSNTAADPLLPRTPVEIDGKTYDLCFDFRSLREAEAQFRAHGHSANLLVAFRDFSFEAVSLVFPCAIARFHPEISWEQAQSLVTLATVFDIGNLIAQAWLDAQPKPKEEDQATPKNPPEA